MQNEATATTTRRQGRARGAGSGSHAVVSGAVSGRGVIFSNGQKADLIFVVDLQISS